MTSYLNLLDSIVGHIQLLQIHALKAGEGLQGGDAVVGQLQRLQRCVASQSRDLQACTRSCALPHAVCQTHLTVSCSKKNQVTIDLMVCHLCQLIVVQNQRLKGYDTQQEHVRSMKMQGCSCEGEQNQFFQKASIKR